MSPVDFEVYGGVYRDVKLVLTDKLFIPMQGSAIHEGGTFVTTPRISETEGVVRVQTWVKNDNPQKKTCSLQTSIADSAGKVVQLIKSEAVIGPGELYMFDQTSKPVKKPHLWSPDDPYLYNVYSQVNDGKIIADQYTSPLGFRWIRWDNKENDLYLNGQKMVIHGGTRYQEYPWLGDAIPKWITVMDFSDMAENLNYNFLKTGNYPNGKLAYELADSLGLIIEEEVPNIRNQEFSTEVQEQQLKEMIRRDRNHPGIVFWSMGSETNRPVDSKIAAAEDTTRILTSNLIAKRLAESSVKFPDKNLPDENLRGWVYEDHGADIEYQNIPLKHIDPSGTVDIYRIPKNAYYLWKAAYDKKPMVFIQPVYWRPQFLGKKEDITVYSNCEQVELLVNGVSKGILSPDQSGCHCVSFKDVMIEKGTITAKATKNGIKVESKTVMAGEPAKIILKASSERIVADRGSVIIVTADITDSQGNHVYGANNPVKWVISGPAALVGPSVYESDIYKVQEMEGVFYMDMPVSNVIRSTGKPGKIHLSVSASGLNSGTLDIEAYEAGADNSIINEPILKDEGRKPVSRVSLKVSRIEEVPREIKLASDDINAGSSDRSGYSKMIGEYILKNNPSIDTSTIEFRALTDLFASQLLNSNGHIAAVDYNFSVDHYNNCRIISGYINATKLPVLFKDGLKRYYSDIIIRKGVEKNAGDEMNWLNWIPSGGTVVIVQDDKPAQYPKGTILTNSTGLTEIISAVYPQFVNFSAEAKERALGFISKANPYVHITTSGDRAIEGADGKPTNVSYTAEKGQPILIPLLKFIAE